MNYELPTMLTSSQVYDPISGLGGPYAEEAKQRLGTSYDAYRKAFGALMPEMQADLMEQGRQAGIAGKGLLGNLNARGLGRSLMGHVLSPGQTPISGMGSGAMQELALQKLRQQNQIAQGYNEKAFGLNQSMMGDVYGNLDAYRQLTLQKKQLDKQNEFNPLDIAKLGVGVLGVL